VEHRMALDDADIVDEVEISLKVLGVELKIFLPQLTKDLKILK
jgi:hypothetical protein